MPGPDGLSDEDCEALTDLLCTPSEGQGLMMDNGDASDRTCSNTAAVMTAVDCTTSPI